MIEINFVQWTIRRERISDFRCGACKHLLARVCDLSQGEVEIKCPRCKALNKLKLNNLES